MIQSGGLGGPWRHTEEQMSVTHLYTQTVERILEMLCHESKSLLPRFFFLTLDLFSQLFSYIVCKFHSQHEDLCSMKTMHLQNVNFKFDKFIKELISLEKFHQIQKHVIFTGRYLLD